jgi:hypothetical protein
MPSADIDACCLIDLLASGHAEAILQACGYTWHLPVSVQTEVLYIRRPDPDQAGKLVLVEADLGPFISSGALILCQPDNDQELDRFTQYATQFRSDGEAMCVALAESRGWTIATDDRKAIRIAQQAGLTVLSCPQLIKTWADHARPSNEVLVKTLNDIELLAQFRPNPSLPEYQWWVDNVGN